MYLLDLFFPPLVTLALRPGGGLGSIAILAAAVAGPGATGPRASWRPGGDGGLLALYALSPPPVMGLPARYLASLLALPYYVAWKLAVRRRPEARRLGPDASRAPGPGLNPTCAGPTPEERRAIGRRHRAVPSAADPRTALGVEATRSQDRELLVPIRRPN